MPPPRGYRTNKTTPPPHPTPSPGAGTKLGVACRLLLNAAVRDGNIRLVVLLLLCCHAVWAATLQEPHWMLRVARRWSLSTANARRTDACESYGLGWCAVTTQLYTICSTCCVCISLNINLAAEAWCLPQLRQSHQVVWHLPALVCKGLHRERPDAAATASLF